MKAISCSRVLASFLNLDLGSSNQLQIICRKPVSVGIHKLALTIDYVILYKRIF